MAAPIFKSLPVHDVFCVVDHLRELETVSTSLPDTGGPFIQCIVNLTCCVSRVHDDHNVLTAVAASAMTGSGRQPSSSK